MDRKNNWEVELTSYLRSVARKPFCWRKHNCFIFAVDAIEAMTGVNYGKQILGEYVDICHDQQSAREYLITKGYKSHVHMIAKNFTPRPSVLNMFRGDLSVMRDLNGDAALGICQGEKVYMAGPVGLMTIPAQHVRKAFIV